MQPIAKYTDHKDTLGFIWDVVLVFDSTIPPWAERLVVEGFWVPLCFGGFDNAVGFSWHNVPEEDS